jgi:hypothetical protein
MVAAVVRLCNNKQTSPMRYRRRPPTLFSPIAPRPSRYGPKRITTSPPAVASTNTTPSNSGTSTSSTSSGDNCHISHRLSFLVRRLPDGVILRHRTTDVTVRQRMILMILRNNVQPNSLFNEWIIVVVVMENILVVASCPNHQGRPLLQHPLPLPSVTPSDDVAIQQSTNNQPNLNANGQNCNFMNQLTLHRLKCLQRDAYDVNELHAAS